MGAVKGILLVIVSVLLFVVFLLGNVLLTLDKSLDYETIKPELVSNVKEVIEDKINISKIIDEKFEAMELYCLNNSEFIFSEESYTFVIPCDVVAGGTDVVIDYSIGSFVDKFYNGEIEYDGFDFVKLKDSVNSYFYIALVVALVLFVLVFFLVEVKSNAFIISGSLLTISSLPLIKIEQFLSWIPFDFAEFFIVFFSEANTVFLISFITGLVVLAVGIVMKFFGVGFKIFDFVNKFNKKGGGNKVVKKVFVQEKATSGKSVKPNNL